MLKRLMASLVLLSAGAIFSCSDADKKAAGQRQNAVATVEAFDIHGVSHHLGEWIGKRPVVLNFWGTWCGPCRREVPDLVRLYSEYSPRGIEMLGLAVNDHPDKVAQFIRQFGMDWVMLMASREITIKYGIFSGIPQTIFIDRNGQEVKRFVGAQSYQTLQQGFEAIL
ncbi:MAG TPA: TlpA disulfide reductase family protein [Candidatus Deferrimicrobium sp.]|nr:TlpA disulfide reductase family protein [Candidatus Deferrimicrobium sp.]